MPRIVHYRLYGLPSDLHSQVESQFRELGEVRDWRGSKPWVATDSSRSLFETEYLRHLRQIEGAEISGGGFLKAAGDETDVLVLTLFLRDLSSQHGIRISIRDDDHPLAKLRSLQFSGGRMPSGNTLEDLLSRRVVIKRIGGRSISFYSPSHPLNAGSSTGYRWGYGVFGLRAYAPTLLEAEREALKILRAMEHLES
jgi:hypothetical protein